MDSFDDDNNDGNLRQRLWGGAVFVAILVIVLPLLLDGAGSESQFRRVEKLRQEPPRIVDSQGISVAQRVPEMRSTGGTSLVDPRAVAAKIAAEPGVDIKIGEDDPPDYMKPHGRGLQGSHVAAPITAFVVQAGSFRDYNNALAIRDRLRRAGFASFVQERETETDPFRVLIGPMISEQSARVARDKVFALLGHDAVVRVYP